MTKKRIVHFFVSARSILRGILFDQLLERERNERVAFALVELRLELHPEDKEEVIERVTGRRGEGDEPVQTKCVEKGGEAFHEKEDEDGQR